MAIFVFHKNSDGQEGSLYRIADNQTNYDANKNWGDGLYDTVTVSDSDFEAVKLGNKTVVSKTGNSVTYRDMSVRYNFAVDLQEEINRRISDIEQWLKSNSSKPMASGVTTYLNYLKNLKATDIVTDPSESATVDDDTAIWSDGTALNSTLETYAQGQGQTVYSSLQLL